MKKLKNIKHLKSKLLVCLVLCLSACTLVGCFESDSTDRESDYQEELMSKAEKAVGMPNITEFTEKKMAKMIWEMRDDSDLVTYSYISNMDGKFIYLGQSIGYGLPYSTQYTAPEKLAYEHNNESTTIPQADPNGLYSGDGLSSTWVMLVDETTGQSSPVYVEQELFVSTYKLPRRLCVEDSLPDNY